MVPARAESPGLATTRALQAATPEASATVGIVLWIGGAQRAQQRGLRLAFNVDPRCRLVALTRYREEHAAAHARTLRLHRAASGADRPYERSRLEEGVWHRLE
jgi:hypothetical protein